MQNIGSLFTHNTAKKSQESWHPAGKKVKLGQKKVPREVAPRRQRRETGSDKRPKRGGTPHQKGAKNHGQRISNNHERLYIVHNKKQIG